MKRSDTVKYIIIVCLSVFPPMGALLLVSAGGLELWPSLLLVFCCLSFALYFTYRWLLVPLAGKKEEVRKAVERSCSLEMLKKQAQFDALQGQINPHFLYNSLESIRGQAVYEGIYTVAEMAHSLSRFFRYNISFHSNLVTLRDEIGHASSYVKIQNYRFHDKYRLVLDIQEELLLDCRLPHLILQPLVENAILHGLKNSREPVESITVQAYGTGQYLVIRVIDKGSGIEPRRLERLNRKIAGELPAEEAEPAKPHNGIALENINSRIRLLCGDAYGISLFSAVGMGTTVELLLARQIKEEVGGKA